MIEQYVDMNAKLYRISCVNISFNTCTLDWRSACDSCLICSLPRFVAKVSCSLSVVGIIHVPATRRMAADWTSLRSAAAVSTAPRAMCAYNGLAWELPQIHSHMPPTPTPSWKHVQKGITWDIFEWRPCEETLTPVTKPPDMAEVAMRCSADGIATWTRLDLYACILRAPAADRLPWRIYARRYPSKYTGHLEDLLAKSYYLIGNTLPVLR